MRDYKKLLVWEKSHELTLEIYKVLSDFPKEEMFGLISQMKDLRVQFQQTSLNDLVDFQIKILLDFYL